MHDPSKIAAAVGERLRVVRTRRGMSLKDVEVKSGDRFSAVAVGTYERAERRLAVSQLYELADLYGVPVTDLLPDSTGQSDPVKDLAVELAVVIERRVQALPPRKGRSRRA